MAGGPSSPTARNGVDGLLIKSSISETLGRRISIEGLRLYGTHTNHKLQSERHKRKTKESIERKIERFDVRFMDTFAFRSSFDAREKKIGDDSLNGQDVFTFSMNQNVRAQTKNQNVLLHYLFAN